MAEILKIGRIVSLSGSEVIFVLGAGDNEVGLAVIENLQVGSLVKLQTPRAFVFGLITGLSIPIPAGDSGEKEQMIGELELIGECRLGSDGNPGIFSRGVSSFPGLGQAIFAVNGEDIAMVYAKRSDDAISIGCLHQDQTLPAYVSINELLGRHFAVLGTTGSGKSCSVTIILQGLLEALPNSHIVLLDAHGEYANAFGDQAEAIEPNNLQLPYWLFNFEELVEVIFGAESADMTTEIALLRDLVNESRQKFAAESDAGYTITVDTPVPYKLGDLNRLIDETMGKLDSRSDITPYRRIKNRLAALQADRRYSFMFPSAVYVRDNMAELLGRIFRIPVDGKPIAILNLTGVPSEILNVVVAVVCRLTFDFAMWSEQAAPILLVCEEAHRYAPNDKSQGLGPAARALSRIAREGRKYGVSLGVVSQRPSDLDPVILSQCNTVFALRMTSEADQDMVKSSLADSASGLIDSLPSLGNAEAIAVGEGVSVPMRLAFKELPEDKRPKSATADFTNAWLGDADDPSALMDNIVDRWRRQKR